MNHLIIQFKGKIKAKDVLVNLEVYNKWCKVVLGKFARKEQKLNYAEKQETSIKLSTNGHGTKQKKKCEQGVSRRRKLSAEMA